ncbi:MAG TPA: hypothetical protein VFX89_22880 [Gammaproteobacteria bacterium]|nr:hypothetical protein [Gammaproteobacteria bacterium]
MKRPSLVARAFAALFLGALGPSAYACNTPALVAIPAKDKIGNQADAIRSATGEYFQQMQAYVACIQAELADAGGDKAPPVQRAALIARNNAAVAEATAVKKLFDANVGAAPPATLAPQSDVAARKFIETVSKGAPDYTVMSSELTDSIRAQLAEIQKSLTNMGAVRSVELRGVDDQGHGVYDVRHERGYITWLIGLAADGKVDYAALSLPEGK